MTCISRIRRVRNVLRGGLSDSVPSRPNRGERFDAPNAERQRKYRERKSPGRVHDVNDDGYERPLGAVE